MHLQTEFAFQANSLVFRIDHLGVSLTDFAFRLRQLRSKTVVRLPRRTELRHLELIFIIIKCVLFQTALCLHIFMQLSEEVCSRLSKHLFKAEFVSPLLALIIWFVPLVELWSVVGVKPIWVVWLVILRRVVCSIWLFLKLLSSKVLPCWLIPSLLEGMVVALA